MTKVLICGDLAWADAEAKEMFAGLAEIVRMDSPDRDDFLKNLKPGGKYAGIICVYRHNISADFIGVFDSDIIFALAETGVKWIAHNGAGYDQIDISACISQGIKVSNTPGAVDDATATTALYLIISTLRQYSKAERNLRKGAWKSGLYSGRAFDLTGKTLAILGMGGIGTRIAELVHAFPMRVIYHNRRPAEGAPSWTEYYPRERLAEFLKGADVLAISIPLKQETEGLVGEEMIRGLKKGAIIINTARGKILDEDAIFRALEDGHLGGVGLDVYPNEPEVNPRLLEFDNVTLLPHMGTETKDSQKKMELRALGNLKDFLVQGSEKDLVLEMRPAGL
ncbi:hypothetical protein BDM02DRAFT_3092038 [Thelephora ganbajun]|uniref:Uncharacterized protein n=1 Tax=Thelephora ganbajun TaxID=370292 RepID=A0ACB6ZN28_THEGA|nr:hypothetical protein BDM02DRAFT_3092038 [Thelephora ganbajun]